MPDDQFRAPDHASVAGQTLLALEGQAYGDAARSDWKGVVSLETVRADLPAAHFGLGMVVVASVIVGLLAGPVAGVLVAGAFAALFLVVLVIVLLRGPRGLDAGRRAYLFTFGWSSYVTP
ncbi:hypothetical protein [Streptomyces mirabilis]|uniref:hypothetical protein n=1 Tax=Streptomyces mirabilis TaxID=68239 RepID=UPI003325554F